MSTTAKTNRPTKAQLKAEAERAAAEAAAEAARLAAASTPVDDDEEYETDNYESGDDAASVLSAPAAAASAAPPSAAVPSAAAAVPPAADAPPVPLEVDVSLLHALYANPSTSAVDVWSEYLTQAKRADVGLVLNSIMVNTERTKLRHAMCFGAQAACALLARKFSMKVTVGDMEEILGQLSQSDEGLSAYMTVRLASSKSGAKLVTTAADGQLVPVKSGGKGSKAQTPEKAAEKAAKDAEKLAKLEQKKADLERKTEEKARKAEEKAAKDALAAAEKARKAEEKRAKAAAADAEKARKAEEKLAKLQNSSASKKTTVPAVSAPAGPVVGEYEIADGSGVSARYTLKRYPDDSLVVVYNGKGGNPAEMPVGSLVDGRVQCTVDWTNPKVVKILETGRAKSAPSI